MTEDQPRELLASLPHLAITAMAEVFLYTLPGGATIVWNIDQAKQKAAATGQLEAVDREVMSGIIQRYEWDPRGVSDGLDDEPGIAAPILCDGERQYLLIDGVHRLVRAYRTGETFEVHVLSDADSRACVLHAPPGVIP